MAISEKARRHIDEGPIRRRFISAVAEAFNEHWTVEQMDAAYAKARADIIEFMKANGQ